MILHKKTFILSFLPGMLSLWLCIISTLLCCFSIVALFEQALKDHTVAPQMLEESEIHAFAQSTISYLSGIEEDWYPIVPFEIPYSFFQHMEKMRFLIGTAKGVSIGITAIYVVILWICHKLNRFSKGAFFLGVLLTALFLMALVVWSLIDFSGFWLMLHRCLLPDGIFSAREPIMQLFPVSLFQSYFLPFLFLFLLFVCVILALPVLMTKYRKRCRKEHL